MVYLKFKTDREKLIIVVYCYRNRLYLKDNEIDLMLTKDQSLLAKRVYLLSHNDIFLEQFIVLDETTVHKQNRLRQEWMFSF